MGSNGTNGNGQNGRAHTNGNGHANGNGYHGIATTNGGLGELCKEPGQYRSDMRLMRSAVARGWTVPDKAFTEGPARVLAIAEGADSERDRLRAWETLRAMHRDNAAIYEMLDKQDRLDSGEATEHIAVQGVEIEFDRNG